LVSCLVRCDVLFGAVWRGVFEMSRQAMQLALEALEDANDVARMEFSDENYYSEAINALRQALKTEQEPVAFINVEKQKLEWAKLTSWHTPTIVNLPKIPLYTAPPKKEWVGLTDQEIHEIDGYEEDRKMYRFARAIEAKLREKNT
jgi:hypothetical protein